MTPGGTGKSDVSSRINSDVGTTMVTQNWLWNREHAVKAVSLPNRAHWTQATGQGRQTSGRFGTSRPLTLGRLAPLGC